MLTHESAQLLTDIVIRVVLLSLYRISDDLTPRIRQIHPEEMWMYKNKEMFSIVPVLWLHLLLTLLPALIIVLMYRTTGSGMDVYQCVMGLTLSMPFTLCLCNFLKLAVGQPRPDFYWRCFPDNRYNERWACTGDPERVIDGRKSFPSNHSAVSFASLGYMFYYMVGKWHVFSHNGLSDTRKLMESVSVLVLAFAVSISRVTDNHHRLEDVIAGMVIGMCVAYMSYRHYYPSPWSENSHFPYALSGNDNAGRHASYESRQVQRATDTAGIVTRFRKRHDSDVPTTDLSSSGIVGDDNTSKQNTNVTSSFTANN